MNVQEAVALLRDHNEWRRGNKTENWDPMPYSPAQLGQAIDVVCNYIESLSIKDDDVSHAKPCWCETCYAQMKSTRQEGAK